ncbi:UDP-glucose 4-epimerase [Actinomadura pelletieri DSM 43383]|uniref:UDP-glucose 4-epimerase n=1 Tax=Actinomadura pelletieri DSM 43383 TaxID=1120940 RepID=A0A495QT63_9ACTN|nr:UDP-glucose 4-epimerase GalE [Actinomadura pelletieri]RKS76591.1 UDP-glucose 4-epimerase [Actinomadura pelletieri DSM 43383]
MKVLITGGAGFIGSTIASVFAERGVTPVVLDSLVTGRQEFTDGKIFYQGDIGDGDLVDKIFEDHPDIIATVHCAALIVVPDSMADPLRYYRVNLTKTLELAGHLIRNECTRMIFASTAGMYRPEADLSVTETSALEPQNPYTRSKMMAELLLQDFCTAYGLRVISLRYLNPIGADPQLRTGLQNSKPTHALGKMIECHGLGVPFTITGVDWETRDGTAIRDYIHVWDIARAFYEATARFDSIIPPRGEGSGYEVINLGTGDGTTVRELVEAFREVVGEGFRAEEAPARPGDVVGAFVNPAKASALLGWKPEYTIEDAIRHSLQWAERRRETDPS